MTVDGWVGRWIDGWKTDRWWMDGEWMEGCMDGCRLCVGWVDGCLSGWHAGWVGGGWMDG